jgi:uncharacterized protein (DUF1778 family)
MVRHQSNRTARIGARIAPHALAIVKRAAQMQGRSLSDFVVTTAQEAAIRAIERAHFVHLSLEDQRRFANGIIKPPQPNKALRRAAKTYKALIARTTK